MDLKKIKLFTSKEYFKDITHHHIQITIIIALVLFLICLDVYYFISFLISSAKI